MLGRYYIYISLNNTNTTSNNKNNFHLYSSSQDLRTSRVTDLASSKKIFTVLSKLRYHSGNIRDWHVYFRIL